jgi:hypothetical protein
VGKSRVQALSLQQVQEELWSLFFGHGILCRPRTLRPYSADKGWEVRFVGLNAAARKRLSTLLVHYRLPKLVVSDRRSPLVVSVSGRRAVWVFQRLWRRHAAGIGSGPKPRIAPIRSPWAKVNEMDLVRGIETARLGAQNVRTGSERRQAARPGPDDPIPF